ncbi:N-acyl homoserine lactonase family protein [Curtobacterium sp. MCBD17_003]|uniref:N-acyl homoserine lactonase family protein n=1 Tax=Curtobacterium sp. MCBD17_003 TaxID=2175667 RepID=UPI000DA77A2F|nr:N-acyl homoserine lactonase family protein [Curtobacterium sp. MCBD17_003]WIE53965.1 N-acyl homoserine lactonase family protein [Curtobacterium sp. MCBD17_003]
MNLVILPLGTCWCAHGVVTPGHLHDEKFSIPVSSYLVELDDRRLLLIDTGMSRDHVTDPDLTWAGTDFARLLTPVMAPEDDIGARLRALGIEPEQIDVVINTHLHFDHAGNNHQFRNATFLAQREHHAYALDNPSFPNQYWNLPELHYELLDGGGEVLPGVEIVVTSGHAPGHQSVIVHLPEEGDLVICGDAIYLQDNLDLDNWEAMADPDQARASAARLRDLEAGGARLLYGHDPDQVADFPRAPYRHR